MTIAFSVSGDAVIHGGLFGITELSYPAGSIVNADISADAGIGEEKLDHLHYALYSQVGSAANETRIIHMCVADGGGTILQFSAGSIGIAVAPAVVTLDLQKNGVTVLDSVITLDSANEAYLPENAILLDTSIADGEILTVVITSTAGTGTAPTDVFCCVAVGEPYPIFT